MPKDKIQHLKADKSIVAKYVQELKETSLAEFWRRLDDLEGKTDEAIVEEVKKLRFKKEVYKEINSTISKVIDEIYRD